MNKIINTEYKDYGNALKGHNNSAWGNALRYDGDFRLLRYARNDVHLTPALSKGEGAFPSLETERSRSFGGVRGGQIKVQTKK